MSEHLARLAMSREDDVAVATHRAYLSSTQRSLHIELLDGDGSLLAERRLDKTGTCDDLALAAAVVLATWEAKLNPALAAKATSLPATAAAEQPAIVTKPLEVSFDFAIAGDTAIGNAEVDNNTIHLTRDR